MSRRTVIAIVLVGVALLAGCGGAADGPTRTPTGDASTPTVATTQRSPPPAETASGTPTSAVATPTTTVATTTSEVTTPTPDPAPIGNASLPPGVATAGVIDAGALVETHSQRVRSRGYASRTTLSIAGPEVNVTRTIRQRWARDGTFLIESTTRSSMGDSAATFYPNGTTTVVRRVLGNRTTYSAIDRGFYASQWNRSTTLEAFVSFGAFEVRDTSTGDGTTLVTLEASTPRNASDVDLRTTEMALPSPDRISTLDATMVVDLDGRIHALAMAFNLSAEGSSDEARFGFRYRLENTGVAGVDRPSWIETARKRVTMADVAVDVRDDVVAITHQGGDAIPANASVSLVRTGNRTRNTTMVTGTLSSSLEPGETAYFYRPEGASGFEGRVVVGDRPSGDVAPLPDAFRLTIGRQGEIIVARIVQESNR